MFGSKSSSTFYCAACKFTVKHDDWFFTLSGCCPGGHQLINAGKRWRAPKKKNHKAWKRIAAGDIWWDNDHIERKGRKSRRAYNERLFSGISRREWLDKKALDNHNRFHKHGKAALCSLCDPNAEPRLYCKSLWEM